ncbi:MAG: type II toxin-antitoxin system VapC family toxin [Betaproteobacteria bacterium]
MRLLLDTHILLWALGQPKRLPAAALPLLEDPANDVLFSAASIWEIAIKSQIGRADFAASAERIAHAASESGFVELPIRAEHCARTATLPFHHRDPFDRLLIAQAQAEPARLLTVDAQLAPYSELVTLL